MAKVVYNRCFGGFGVSIAGYRRYCELTGTTPDPEIIESRWQTWNAEDVPRHDPNLVRVVEELGKAASAELAGC